MPCTRATTGCGIRVRLIIMRAQRSKSSRCQRSSAAWTTARTDGSAAAASISACNAAIIASDNGLNRSPRFKVSVSTPASNAVATSGRSSSGTRADAVMGPPAATWALIILLPSPSQDDPNVGARSPRLAAVIAENPIDDEAGVFEPRGHLRHRQRTERQREAMLRRRAVASLDVALRERREPAAAILTDRFDERQMAPADAAAQLHAMLVLPPFRDVGHQVDAERTATIDHAADRVERGRE